MNFYFLSVWWHYFKTINQILWSVTQYLSSLLQSTCLFLNNFLDIKFLLEVLWNIFTWVDLLGPHIVYLCLAFQIWEWNHKTIPHSYGISIHSSAFTHLGSGHERNPGGDSDSSLSSSTWGIIYKTPLQILSLPLGVLLVKCSQKPFREEGGW